jgi:hypothetical protein
MSTFEQLERGHAAYDEYLRGVHGSTLEQVAEDEERLRESREEEARLAPVPRGTRQYHAPPLTRKSLFTVAELERRAELDRLDAQRRRQRDAAAAAAAAASTTSTTSSTLKPPRWLSPVEGSEEDDDDDDDDEAWRERRRSEFDWLVTKAPPPASLLRAIKPSPPPTMKRESYSQKRDWAAVDSDEETTEEVVTKRRELGKRRAQIPVITLDDDDDDDAAAPLSPALPSEDTAVEAPAPAAPSEADLSSRMVALTEHWIDASNATPITGAAGRVAQENAFEIYRGRANALTRALAQLEHIERLVGNFSLLASSVYFELRAHAISSDKHYESRVLRAEPVPNTIRWLLRPRRLPLPQMFMRFKLLEDQPDADARWPIIVSRRGALIDTPARLLANDEFDVRSDWLESLDVTQPLAFQYDDTSADNVNKIRASHVALVPRLSLESIRQPLVPNVVKFAFVNVQIFEAPPPPLKRPLAAAAAAAAASGDTGWLTKRK